MATPRKMSDHMLDPVKGWPSPYAVDFTGKLASSVTLDPVPEGRVVSLDSNGDFVVGASGTAMPMFLIGYSDDPDVSNPGGSPVSEVDVWVPSIPDGDMTALPAVGAYELESTEFDQAGSYPPGALLRSDGIGRLTVGSLGTHNIVGVVSRAPHANHFGKQAISFWPVYMPAGV